MIVDHLARMIPWRPVLGGERARAAIAVAEELGEVLLANPPPSPDLGSGAAASALVFAYLHRACPGHGWDAQSVAELDRAIDLLGSFEPRSELFLGMTGVAWTADHLTRTLFVDEDAGDDDQNEQVDAFLLDQLDQDRWDGDLDLIGGLAGIAVYALGRRERTTGRRMLARIVHHLGARAERGADGIAWRSPPLLATNDEAARMRDGYFDLGVAHGVPGLLALLAQLDAIGLERPRVRPMLAGAAAWLMRQRLSAPAPASFADVAAPEGNGEPARLAWCRGDPGAATALYRAARALG